MMTTLKEINDIFTIFHDGSIEGAVHENSGIRLKIDCQYLAEQINPNFEYFFVNLKGLIILEFTPWFSDNQTVLWTDPQRIFESELEVSGSRIEGGAVVVTVNQHNPSHNYKGGELKVSSRSVNLLNEDETPLLVGELKAISKRYWDSI